MFVMRVLFVRVAIIASCSYVGEGGGLNLTRGKLSRWGEGGGVCAVSGNKTKNCAVNPASRIDKETRGALPCVFTS